MEWSVNLGNLLTIVTMVTITVAAYYALQRSFDARFAALALQINSILEGDIRELRGRVTMIESGQSEWIKSVRDRTHKLADDMNVLVLKVDRIERERDR